MPASCRDESLTMSYRTKIIVFSFLVFGMAAWGVLMLLPTAIHTATSGMISPEDAHRRREIKRLASVDIAAEVDSAIARRDYRIVGVYGVGFICPGVDFENERYDYDTMLDEFGTRAMGDTSDARESEAHSQYQHAAYQYALAYNTRLIDELDRLGKLPQTQTPENKNPEPR